MNAAQTISEERAIREYLGILQYRASCLVLALGDARKCTGRNVNTGKKIHDSTPGLGCWLGAIAYMALLDQIGSSLKPKGEKTDGKGIHKALRYFSNLSDQEIEAIYALRCAFAHDYNLANKNGMFPNRQHVFTVDKGKQAPLIKLPDVPWNGDYKSVGRENKTVINLELFGDLVESIYQDLCTKARREELEIALSDGVDELRVRYFITIT